MPVGSGFWQVYKFGGSSLANDRAVAATVARIGSACDSDCETAVVVSAMGDTTDCLLEAASAAAEGDATRAEKCLQRVRNQARTDALGSFELCWLESLLTDLAECLRSVARQRRLDLRVRDHVLSFGERISAPMIASRLVSAGVDAIAIDARSWLRTDDNFGEARVSWEYTRETVERLNPGWKGVVTVHTGFIGATATGDTTTLGRNGSDYTATLLARALRARDVTIWTESPGVMTADPALVKNCYPIARMSYQEALELANFGARMFHPRTMIPLVEGGIGMIIRSTFSGNDSGTVIAARKEPGNPWTPTSVASLENLSAININCLRLANKARIGQRLLHALEQRDVTVWMAVMAAHGQVITVIVPRSQLQDAQTFIQEHLADELRHEEIVPVQVESDVALITLVGDWITEQSNVAGRFFRSLGDAGIDVHAIGQGSGSPSISAAIPSRYTARAVRRVHAAFNFTQTQACVLVVGTGTVGSEFLRQIDSHRDQIRARLDLDLRVGGVANSRGFLEVGEDDAMAALTELQGLPPKENATTVGALSGLLHEIADHPCPILVDCTAADGMGALYEEAIGLGFHVVSANKKPLTGTLESYEALLARARSNHRRFLYETTVGAGLPIISTLRTLVTTGDKVHRVEGGFSGSLGYISSRLMAGARISEAVKEAETRGYTEPEAAEDLTGHDVARKALILARELGYQVKWEELNVEPLVDLSELNDSGDAALDDFLRALDARFHKHVVGYRNGGRFLQYLAEIETRGSRPVKVRIGPRWRSADSVGHLASSTSAFVCFYTERYRAVPLRIQGPGAGAAVTASGLLNDAITAATWS